MKITQGKIFRKKWSSQRAFILSTIAAAVGLGNIWRFPYIAGENGGATFIIAYLVAVLALGIPLMITEFGAGKILKGGPVKIFKSLGGKTKYFGWLVIGLTLIIMSYYLVITGWTLGYAVKSIFGVIPTFAQFTSTLQPLLFFGIVAAITGFIVAKGVRTIERMSLYLVPILIVIVLFLTIYGLTLEGASQAAHFLFKPNFSNFLSPSLWLLAFGQAFFSLSIGQGALTTYGSFLPKKTNLPKSAGWVALVETGIALVAGLMIFPLVFSFGINPSEGIELAFTSLPLAFQSLSFGPYLAIAFFWLFFLAALSSCIAGMEVIKTGMREEFKLNHKSATVAAFLPLLPLGVFSALSFSSVGFEFLGRPFLEVLDLFAANQLLIALGVIGGAILGWKLPRKELINSFQNKHRKIASYIINVSKYLWAIVLGILIISFII